MKGRLFIFLFLKILDSPLDYKYRYGLNLEPPQRPPLVTGAIDENYFLINES